MLEQAEVAREAFNSFGILTFINDISVMRAAWQIADKEKLPTLYNAMRLTWRVAEITARQNGEEC